MSENSSKDWNAANTLCLIKLIGEQLPDCPENSNEIYIQAANQLFELGLSKSYIECKNKWKELVNGYKKHKENPIGPEPAFYTKIDAIFSDVPDSSTANFRPWTETETNTMIKIIKMHHFIIGLKNDDSYIVYEEIGKKLEETGYPLRDKEDLKQRWTQLKRSYLNYIKGDVMHFKHFEAMDALLDWQPNGEDLNENDDESYPNSDVETDSKQMRKKSNNWTHKETDLLLSVIKEYNYPKIKRSRKTDMFDTASLQLRSEGYKRSSDQCRIKFKHMKTKYFQALRKTSYGLNPENYCPHFETMQQIMNVNQEVKDEMDSEHYEIEYLEDYPNDYLYEKVFAENLNEPTRSYKNRPVWSERETHCLIKILKNKNIKRYSRRPFFEEVSQEMLKAGYERPAHMCMVKWKNLRRQLNESIRSIVKGEPDICPFYDELSQLMQNDGTSIDVPREKEFDSEDCDSKEPNQVAQKRPAEEEEVFPTPEIKLFKGEEESESVCSYKMDDIEHYCMSLAPTLKRLTNKKQAKLKIEIQKLLYQAEYDEEF